MEKNQFNEIFVSQTERQKKIKMYICILIFLVAFSCFFLILYVKLTNDSYGNYNEKSDLDYKVYLNDNEFFNKSYLASDNQYIASLIEKIEANFKYSLDVSENMPEYKYSYGIKANVSVKDKETENSLYDFTEDLVRESVYTQNDNSDVDIKKSIDIDYNKYNNLIKKFVDAYDLDDSINTLDIVMYVRVFGKYEDLETAKKKDVVSLSIPLTTKTVAIDMSYDLVDENPNNIIVEKEIPNFYIIFLLLGIDGVFLIGYCTFLMIRYIIKSRTPESIYNSELKKILNNYRSFIQEVNNNFDLTGYQVIKVASFVDMLEIRDTVQEPILMVSRRDKMGVYFLIPAKTNIVYMYTLRVNDMKNKINSQGINNKKAKFKFQKMQKGIKKNKSHKMKKSISSFDANNTMEVEILDEIDDFDIEILDDDSIKDIVEKNKKNRVEVEILEEDNNLNTAIKKEKEVEII